LLDIETVENVKRKFLPSKSEPEGGAARGGGGGGGGGGEEGRENTGGCAQEGEENFFLEADLARGFTFSSADCSM